MSGTIHALIRPEEAGEGPEAAAEAGVRWAAHATMQEFLRAVQGSQAEDLVLLSLGVEGVDPGLAEKVAEQAGGGRLILSAKGASLELAVLARRLGAGALLREPLGAAELRRELRRRAPVVDGIPLPAPPPGDKGPPLLVGSSEAMAEVVGAIAEVGDTPAPVLITGESGTGKELVARAIHWASTRREAPFVAINCAAIPEHLLESEFFGHERGAFTGAVARKRGRFERADRGTLFLDEIGDMKLVLQAKILRALEEGSVERVGGESAIQVDTRVVAASNRSLEERVASGEFREDLYYRLAAARIHLPALRERPGDIQALAVHFAAAFAARYGLRVEGVDRQAVRLLESHAWPGNVRELRNVMDRAVRACRGGWIRPDDLAIGADAPRLSAGADRAAGAWPVTASLEEIEREHIARVLAYTGGAMGETAQILGIHRNTLTRKAEAYGLRRGE